MILRALFWISVVAIFMPHEPDLGLGRPTRAADLDGGEGGTLHCREGGACATALDYLDRFQAIAVRNLAEVKADIEREKHRRATTPGD
jgi:hypothetical protein